MTSSPTSSDNASKGSGRSSRRVRRPTQTSSFGVSRRESHDSSIFYARFDAPELSDDDEIRSCSVTDRLFCADSRDMSVVEDKSISLVVTSPPYFSAKLYEEALGEGHVPGSYLEYLTMLEDVFADCRRVLEPGGRIGVNVANLGRRPYRSLSKDVWVVLERLGFLSQGEVVWIKGKGPCFGIGGLRLVRQGVAAGAAGPDRARPHRLQGSFRAGRPLAHASERGLPWESTITKEDFLAWTVDTWEMRPESATRVGHPAPFPVELPRRLIELYTYRGDVVLDPFMGSGSTAVAAVEADRRFVGFDADPAYQELAEQRVAEAATSVAQ